jgi:hypothetical protein
MLKDLTMLPVGLQVLKNVNAIETLTNMLMEKMECNPDALLKNKYMNVCTKRKMVKTIHVFFHTRKW